MTRCGRRPLHGLSDTAREGQQRAPRRRREPLLPPSAAAGGRGGEPASSAARRFLSAAAGVWLVQWPGRCRGPGSDSVPAQSRAERGGRRRGNLSPPASLMPLQLRGAQRRSSLSLAQAGSVPSAPRPAPETGPRPDREPPASPQR